MVSKRFSLTSLYRKDGVYPAMAFKQSKPGKRSGVDKFRIKIWDKNNADAIVYDNQLNAPDSADPSTVLGGGSIVIQK